MSSQQQASKNEVRKNLFSDNFIEKHVFEKAMLTTVGRDLKIPQSVALAQCRQYSSKLYQVWCDGFSISYAQECLIDWIIEGAKTDDDLFWHLHKRCRSEYETQ